MQVKNWVKELRKMLGNEICLCIVGKYSLACDSSDWIGNVSFDIIFQTLL